MKINNRFTGTEPALDIAATARGTDGAERGVSIRLLREHEMEIYVNEELTMRLVCTPDCLPELVLGRLLTEGIIRGAEDVDLLYLCEFGKTARVLLREYSGPSGDDAGDSQPYIDLTPSCCTGNQTLSGRYLRGGELPLLPETVRDADRQAALVRKAAARFAQDTRLHRETGSTHSCFLLSAEDGEILFEAEDIGRHNAIDKVVGHALIEGIDLSSTALFISGRVPVDVAVKVIRAGVPVLISKELPTADVVELAKAQRLVLIGRAREDGFLIF